MCWMNKDGQFQKPMRDKERDIQGEVRWNKIFLSMGISFAFQLLQWFTTENFLTKFRIFPQILLWVCFTMNNVVFFWAVRYNFIRFSSASLPGSFFSWLCYDQVSDQCEGTGWAMLIESKESYNLPRIVYSVARHLPYHWLLLLYQFLFTVWICWLFTHHFRS